MRKPKPKVDLSNLDFESYQSRMNAPGRWVCVVPLSGVILTKGVDFEFRLNRVHLVSREKLPRIRKRLGIPRRLSALKKNDIGREFFETAQTYGITWLSNVSPRQARVLCRQTLKDELAILALSQLGYSRRTSGAIPRFKGLSGSGTAEEYLFELKGDRRTWSGAVIGKMQDLVLDASWLNFQKTTFFLPLLKVIRREIDVDDNWRRDLQRAAIFVGQGLCSSNLPQSFLWNMIALETLFKDHGEKFSDEFPKRAEAFLGWTGYWQTQNYATRIHEIYGKRCDLVHEGISDRIAAQDLVFTDDLVYNLLVNILQHIGLFNSKRAVTDFAKKVEAEHILGRKSRVRPKRLTFLAKKYDEGDLERI